MLSTDACIELKHTRIVSQAAGFRDNGQVKVKRTAVSSIDSIRKRRGQLDIKIRLQPSEAYPMFTSSETLTSPQVLQPLRTIVL